MEGMPRFPMFAPDFKLGCNSLEENGFQEKIFSYIRSHYGQNPDDFVEDMTELNKIRNYCLLPYPAEDLIPYMKRYYAQLLLLSNQFPLDGKHPDLTFEWQWSDRLHDPNNVLILNDVQFELCNILYNLACIHAQIGAELPRENDEGIKKAFTHFGYAAYPLQVLRDEMNATRFPTLDFDRDTISLYLNLIMGQAQECMVEKALVESRKPLVIARLTSHLHDIYSKCAEHLVHGPLGDIMSASKYKEWVRMCTVKSSTYGAISMLYQGMEAEENKKYGDRVAYYDAALSHITTARNHCSKETRRAYLETVAFVDDVVNFKAADAKKENDFIYHAKIPKPEEITMAEPLAMSCAYSFNALDPSVAGAQLFNGLVPPSVIKASSEYDEKKAALKRSVLEKVEAYDVELAQFVERLDLTRMLKMIVNPYGARVEAESSTFMLPEELLSANSYFSVQRRDAVPEVLEQLNVVGEQARTTDALLAELIARLDAIPVAELPNASSSEGVGVIKAECAKLLEASDKAKKTNMNLRLAVTERMEAIQTLGMSLHELVSTLGPREHKDYASSPEGARMLQLGDKVEEMKRQRKSLIDKMHEEFLKDNINGKLLIERDTDHGELFEKELKKHDNLLNLLEQNLTAQQRILNALLESHADFAESGKELREQAEKRNMRIIDLIAASDEYFRVIAELEQAALFYERLDERAKKINQAVETIESTFSDFFKKRHEAMASAERKAAEERAMLDARAAMEDFSMPALPSLSSPLQLPAPLAAATARRTAEGAPRRRLGDYMQYYREKMGGGAGALPPSGSASSGPSSFLGHLPYAHAHHPVQPGPPLPPLSLASLPSAGPAGHNYAESSGAPSPAPSTVSNLSYAPPTHQQQQPQPMIYQPPMQPPTQQGFPRYGGPLPPQSLQQPYAGYGMQPSQPQLQQQPQYAPAPAPPKTTSTPGAMPSHAPYVPPQLQQHQQQHGFPPAAAAASHYAPPPQVQPQQQPPAAQYAPMPAQASPPPTSYQAPPVHRAPLPTYSMPPSAQQSPFPPPGPQSAAPYSQFPQTAAAAASSPFAAPSLPPHSATAPWMQGGGVAAAATAGRSYAPPPPPQTTQMPPPPAAASSQNAQPAVTSTPASAAASAAAGGAVKQLPSLADLGAQLRAASAAPPMQQPPPPSAAGMAPSPWHRGMSAQSGYGVQQQSPWMQPHPGAALPPPAQPFAPPTMQQQQPAPAAAPPPVQQAPPLQLQQQQLPKRNETMDLLSDLFSAPPTAGPAALQPTGVPTENQIHTTAAPAASLSTSSTSTSSLAPPAAPAAACSPSPSATAIVRPAAAVLPMMQTQPMQQAGGGGGGGESEEQILSISGATSVGYAPSVNGAASGEEAKMKQAGAPISALLSASTFSIGEGDATRLAKKQLHASNRGQGAAPSLDPLDPLNQLDPFWKNK